MNEMMKKVREDKKGFTLAELLIVVAIILVMVAIAIPVFTNSQNSALEATAKADIRAVKAEASAKYLLENKTTEKQLYSATISENGDVSALKEAATGTKISDTASVTTDLKAKAYPITVTVEIANTDIKQPVKP